MPNCNVCGAPLEKMPMWLDEVDIKFQCGRCRETAPGALLHEEPALQSEVAEEPPVVEDELEEAEEEESESEEEA
ncbi:MAG: hypothetical protein H0W86_04535 [Armatimonadetes bacterium]|nr:hypothetical protein [Armatimonadota bacterium]